MTLEEYYMAVGFDLNHCDDDYGYDSMTMATTIVWMAILWL